MRKMWQTAALLVGGGYLALMGLSRALYRKFLYPAPRRGMTTAPAGSELRTLEASDGVSVQALVALVPGRAAEHATVVHFHGNGETIADGQWLASELVARKVSFVAVEYRGYGASPAEDPSEQGLYADAEGVLDALAADGIGAESITLFGSSLGSGVAVEMARRGRGARLILSTPYTSIPAVAQRILPLLPMGFVIGDRFDNLSKASDLDLPTLILHGDRDELVPYDMGVALSRAFPRAELITVPGGHHNDLFVLQRDALLDAIVKHVRR